MPKRRWSSTWHPESRELEKREDDLSKAGVTMLGNVDGKSMVKQMSPQFLEFVLDAYRSLRWARS